MPRNANQSKQSNYSMDFDPAASSGIITSLETEIQGKTELSFSFWFNANTINSFLFSNQVNSSNYRIALYYESASKMSLRFTSGSPQGIADFTPPPLNQWNHFIFTFDGSQTTDSDKLKIYINNSLQTITFSGTIPTETPSTNVGPLVIGNGSWTTSPLPNYAFNGKLDAFSIFDYALSLSQVTTLYGDSTNGPGNPMALPRTPIAYYPLGGSAGAFRTPVNVNDQWLIENNTIGDYVFDFDGATPGDAVTNNTSGITGNAARTVSFWYNIGISSSAMIPFSLGGINDTNSNSQFAYCVNRINSSTTAAIFGRGGNDISPITVPATNDSQWHSVIITYTGSTLALYIDGNNITLPSQPSTYATTDGFKIGGWSEAGNRLFDGKISNVQIFNTALSGPEVETLYNYGSPIRTLANIPQNSNLKAWYKLDATEIYNSTSTEWSVDNNQNPSAYPSSLNFNRATTDSISLGSSSSIRPTGDYTFSIWYNLSSSANAGVWCAATSINSSGLALFKGNSGGLELYHKGTSSTSAVVFLGSASGTLNIWQNAIFTYDDTSRVIKGYLNGNLISTVSVAGTGSVSWANNFYLGRLIQNGNYYLGGRLSNFQIFNTKLEEIGSNSVETLYNSGNPLTDMSSFSSLVSWWKLNNTTTGIQDSKGSNNGTNNGATEYAGFVNTLAGDSSGMSQSNLVQSDLQTVAPYSKYALAFDGTNDYIDCGDSDSFSFGNGTTDSSFSISAWVNMIDATNFITIAKDANSGREYVIRTLSDDKLYFYLLDNINGGYIGRISSGTVTSNQGTWIHTLYTYNGNSTSSGIKIYLNGSQVDNANYEGGSYTAMSNTSTNLNVGRQERGLHYGSGSISNVSIFDSALTSSQVREIYNEGLPSDLNTFSGAAPVAWWQLGSNSSWNGNRWIVADEIGSNNGYSQNMSPYMPESGLTNGVGTTANGVSSGMSEGSLVGDAPYSTANAISSGMAVTARGTDVPPTPTP